MSPAGQWFLRVPMHGILLDMVRSEATLALPLGELAAPLGQTERARRNNYPMCISVWLSIATNCILPMSGWNRITNGVHQGSLWEGAGREAD